MSKERKTIVGIAAIAFGLLLLVSMISASVLRTHRRIAYSTGMAARSAEPSQPSGTEDGGATESSQFGHFHDQDGRHGFRYSPGSAGGFRSRITLPFMFIGGLFRLAAFGLIGYLILRYLHRRGGNAGGGRVLNEVEDEIRVGDEINNRVNNDDLTEEDLLQAMKRLGIKKLEL